MTTDPHVATDQIQNGWHRIEGEPEETCNASDGTEHEITVYYEGDDGRFAEETFYLERNGIPGRVSVWQMSHVGQWAPNDTEHEGEPVFEEYTYEFLGLFDYEATPSGYRAALKERDRFVAVDESDTYTF